MASIAFTDGTGAATLTPTGLGHLQAFLPDAIDVGPNRATLDGSIHQYNFRTDYTGSFEVSPIKPSDLAIAIRLKRHLISGGQVTVNTNDTASRVYTCKLAPGTVPEIGFRDQRLSDYSMQMTLRNTASALFYLDYTSGGA